MLVEPLKGGRGGAQEGRCTEVYFAPAADLLVAAYGGVRTAGAIKRASGPESSGAVVSPGEDLLLSLSLGMPLSLTPDFTLGVSSYGQYLSLIHI